MAIFVDIFMAACLLLALVLGVRQGFLQSLARVAIIIVALLGAAWLAEHLADPAAKWLEPMLTEKIQQQMDGQAAAADDPSLAAAGLLETFGFSGEALDKLVESATEKAQEVGQTLLSAVVSTVLRSVAYAVVALIISFWSAEPAGTGATRFAMIVLALFGALIAFGIYVAGRMIAR